MKKTLKALLPFLERGFSIAALIFPLVEAIAYFGPKVFLNTESLALKNFYVSYIDKVSRFYTENNLLIFIFMVWVFLLCSRRSSPFTKFVRFNVIQAILLNIVYACAGVVFTFLPILLRESMLGLIISNLLFFGMVLLSAYCTLVISSGRMPVIPVVSEAAKAQVQRSY
jgi:uncharacterized membrane protein